MVDQLTSYNYQDSGIEWLGKVPDHWRVMNFGLTHVRADLGGNYLAGEGEDGIPVIKMGNIGRGDIRLTKVERLPKSESYNDEHLLSHGDFLFNTRNSLDLVGKVAVWREEIEVAIYNSNILRIKFNRRFIGNPYFACYLFNSPLVIGLLRLLAKGTTSVAAIYYKDLRRIILAFPPPDEQDAITKFLDYETAKIDALIAKQQQLIALLQEKRQAVISHAVTKGLNPDAPLRDSGVEWLGAVPAHWEVKRAKILFRESKARSAKGEDELLTVSHLTGVTPRSEKDVNMFQAESHEGYKLCEPQDLAINTMWAWMGALGIVTQKGMVSPSYNVYTPVFEGDAWFFDHLVRTPAFIAEIIRWSKGIWSSRLRLYPYEFGQILLPLPPVSERVQIAEYLTFERERYNKIVEAATRQIELLQERRTALIAAAVTGKIDVRGWQPPPAAAGAKP